MGRQEETPGYNAGGELPPKGSFEWWRPWFERGSWAVLIGGGVGVLFRTLFTLQILFNAGGTPSDIQQGQIGSTIAQMLFDLALVVALFVVIRALIIAVPALLDMRNRGSGENE